MSVIDFEQQQNSALLNCPVCGIHEITKTLHVPHVNTGGIRRGQRTAAKDKLKQCVNIDGELSQLLDHIIANTEDVGDAFPEEARKIHYREVPERKIRGSASAEEVGELQEEGIEVLVLPVPVRRFGKSH